MNEDTLADALIVFTPSGRRGRFPVGTPVLQAARSLGVDIDSVCGGRGLCGRCQIVPSIGEFAKHGVSSKAEHLAAFSSTERAFVELNGPLNERRLSCSVLVLGDVVIDVPAESQVHRRVVNQLILFSLLARAFLATPIKGVNCEV